MRIQARFSASEPGQYHLRERMDLPRISFNHGSFLNPPADAGGTDLNAHSGSFRGSEPGSVPSASADGSITRLLQPRRFLNPPADAGGTDSLTRGTDLSLSSFQRRATAKRKPAVEELFEELAFLLGSQDFALAVGRGVQFHMHYSPIAHTANVVNAAIVPAVERVGDAQNGRELHHRVSISLVQDTKRFVPLPRVGAAVITRNVRNHIALSFRKPSQL